MTLDPMKESVGIRQVRADGTKLTPAMALDIVGGGVSTVDGTDGTKVYQLDLSTNLTIDALTQRVQALETQVAAIEPGEDAIVVAHSANITLDWAALGTRTVQVTMPINMPNTLFTPTNFVNGRTYTLILKHPLGGLAADGLVWSTGFWVMSGVFNHQFSGDPNEGIILRFVADNGRMVHIAGLGYSLS